MDDRHAQPTPSRRLRDRWNSPPRRGIRRLISPWEYRHLRGFGIGRTVGGSIAVAAGVVCLAHGAPGWATFFLIVGALDLGVGGWYLALARSPRP